MRKTDKIFEEYKSDVLKVTEQCILNTLRGMRDEISLSIGDIEELLIEDGGVTIHSRAMTEEALCEYMATELLVLKELLRSKERMSNN